MDKHKKFLTYIFGISFFVMLAIPSVIGSDGDLFNMYSNNGFLSVKVETVDGKADIPLLYGDGYIFLGNGKNEDKRLAVSSTNELEYDLSDKKKDSFIVSEYVSEPSEEGSHVHGWSRVLSAEISGKKKNKSVSIKNEVTKKILCKNMHQGSTCAVGNINLSIDEVLISNHDRKITFRISNNGRFDTLFDSTGDNFIEIPKANNEDMIDIWLLLEGGDDLRIYTANWYQGKININ